MSPETDGPDPPRDLWRGVSGDAPQGQALYRAVVRHFRLPRERLGVPALVVGERILVGAWEIPSALPGLVETGLAGTGIDWPSIPEVRSFLSLQGIAAVPTVELQGWMLAGGAAAGGEPVARILGAEGEVDASSVSVRFLSDPAGNAVAVVVLLGMVVVLALSVRRVWRADRPLAEWPVWVVPALAAVGAGIALYLAFVEVTGAEAVCGPVGDCNRVQLSPYASLAGVPIGVLGVAGYLMIGGLWMMGRSQPRSRPSIHLLVWGLAAAGVAFSMYLTFLEPFVIGATCMWCINSALAMTLILMAATPAASGARRRKVAAGGIVESVPAPVTSRGSLAALAGVIRGPGWIPDFFLHHRHARGLGDVGVRAENRRAAALLAERGKAGDENGEEGGRMAGRREGSLCHPESPYPRAGRKEVEGKPGAVKGRGVTPSPRYGATEVEGPAR